MVWAVSGLVQHFHLVIRLVEHYIAQSNSNLTSIKKEERGWKGSQTMVDKADGPLLKL